MNPGDLTLIGGGVIGAIVTAVGLVLSFNRFLLGDRSAMTSLQTEIITLRSELAEERTARRQAQTDNAERIGELERNYDEQRRAKHQTINELTKVQMLLGLIIALAEDCTCGALDRVTHLMQRVSAEMGEDFIGPVPPRG